jgi:hypothetical protein
MIRAWHGRSMASVNQTQPHCVNQMEKTHSKPLAVGDGRGTAWALHGRGMLCVNRPLDCARLGYCACSLSVISEDCRTLTNSSGKSQETLIYPRMFLDPR